MSYHDDYWNTNQEPTWTLKNYLKMVFLGSIACTLLAAAVTLFLLGYNWLSAFCFAHGFLHLFALSFTKPH